MRKTAFFALVPLLAAGLQAQSVSARGGSEIAVRVLSPSPLTNEPIRFELSDPGYIAAFMIYPGHGVRLLYPESNGDEQLWSAGYHSTQLYTSRWDDDIYHAVLGGTGFGPHYLYVIASRYPLQVSRFVHRPALLASSVGQTDARSFLVDVEFDALINNAIALGNDATWDADSYMLWPGSSIDAGSYAYSYGYDGGAYAMRYATRFITCYDGTVRAVPENYPFNSCGHRQRPYVTHVPTAVGGQIARVTPPTVLPSIVGGRSTRTAVKAPTPGPSVTAFTAAGPVEVADANGRSLREGDDDVVWHEENGVWVARSYAGRDHAGHGREAEAGGRFRDGRYDGRERSAQQARNDVPGMVYHAPRLAPAPGFSNHPNTVTRAEAPRAATPRAATPRAAPPASSGGSRRAQ